LSAIDDSRTQLAVKVTPNAGRSDVTGFKEDTLLLKIAAPPDKGKANKELVDFLSERLGIKKSAITIIRGLGSRHKVIKITGISKEEILKRLFA
jgi:hypothetical protein